MARSAVARRLGAGKGRMGKDWYGADSNGTTSAGTLIPAWLVLPSIVHPMQDPTSLATEVYVTTSVVNPGAGAIFGIGIYRFPYITAIGAAIDTIPAITTV